MTLECHICVYAYAKCVCEEPANITSVIEVKFVSIYLCLLVLCTHRLVVSHRKKRKKEKEVRVRLVTIIFLLFTQSKHNVYTDYCQKRVETMYIRYSRRVCILYTYTVLIYLFVRDGVQSSVQHIISITNNSLP